MRQLVPKWVPACSLASAVDTGREVSHHRIIKVAKASEISPTILPLHCQVLH